MAPKKDLYKFHYGSQLPITESRSQKAARLRFEKRTAAEVGRHLRESRNRERAPDERREDSQITFETEPANNSDQIGFNDSSIWEDTEIMNDEDASTLARIRSLHEELIQQQKNKNWKDLLGVLFPVYLHLKKITGNWTLPCHFQNFSPLVCSCTAEMYTSREMDLVDLMGNSSFHPTFL
jgi:hypothetical protein